METQANPAQIYIWAVLVRDVTGPGFGDDAEGVGPLDVLQVKYKNNGAAVFLTK